MCSNSVVLKKKKHLRNPNHHHQLPHHHHSVTLILFKNVNYTQTVLSHPSFFLEPTSISFIPTTPPKLLLVKSLITSYCNLKSIENSYLRWPVSSFQHSWVSSLSALKSVYTLLYLHPLSSDLTWPQAYNTQTYVFAAWLLSWNSDACIQLLSQHLFLGT